MWMRIMWKKLNLNKIIPLTVGTKPSRARTRRHSAWVWAGWWRWRCARSARGSTCACASLCAPTRRYDTFALRTGEILARPIHNPFLIWSFPQGARISNLVHLPKRSLVYFNLSILRAISATGNFRVIHEIFIFFPDVNREEELFTRFKRTRDYGHSQKSQVLAAHWAQGTQGRPPQKTAILTSSVARLEHPSHHWSRRK